MEPFAEHASRTFATQAALALERVQVEESLREDSLQDELAGLGNRRYANRVLAHLQSGDGVAMIDLDHFKDLNDTLGHAAGDDLLRAFAGELTRSLREGDTAARLGGDESLLVLRRAGEHAEATLNRLGDRWRATGSAVTFKRRRHFLRRSRSGAIAAPAGRRCPVRRQARRPRPGGARPHGGRRPRAGAGLARGMATRGYLAGPMAMMCRRSDACARPISIRITGR